MTERVNEYPQELGWGWKEIKISQEIGMGWVKYWLITPGPCQKNNN